MFSYFSENYSRRARKSTNKKILALHISVMHKVDCIGLVIEMVAASTQAVMAKVTDISNVHIIWLKTT